jgi:hypothetical protein
MNPATAINPFMGLSCARCMKNSATSDAFTVAIASAITIFPCPKSIYDAPTVTPVRISSAVRVSA